MHILTGYAKKKKNQTLCSLPVIQSTILNICEQHFALLRYVSQAEPGAGLCAPEATAALMSIDRWENWPLY